MMAVLGALTLALTIVGFGGLLLFVRNPSSPAWARKGALGAAAAMALMILAVAGLIAVLKGLLADAGGGPVEWGLLAIIAVAAIVGWWQLRVGRRLAAFASASGRKP